MNSCHALLYSCNIWMSGYQNVLNDTTDCHITDRTFIITIKQTPKNLDHILLKTKCKHQRTCFSAVSNLDEKNFKGRKTSQYK